MLHINLLIHLIDFRPDKLKDKSKEFIVLVTRAMSLYTSGAAELRLTPAYGINSFMKTKSLFL